MKFLKSKRDPFKVEFACLLDNYDEETPVTNIGVWLEDSEDEFISFIKSQVELDQMDVVHSAPMILTLRDVIEKNVLTFTLSEASDDRGSKDLIYPCLITVTIAILCRCLSNFTFNHLHWSKCNVISTIFFFFCHIFWTTIGSHHERITYVYNLWFSALQHI